MKYHIGDKFIVDGIVGEVLYINNGYAWLFPEKDLNTDELASARHIIKGLAFAKLDSRGRTESGKRAKSVLNTECKAV